MKKLPMEIFEQTLSWLELLQCDERLMIILSAAKLDDLLKNIIRSSMVHQSGNSDPLFDSDRPLGSFSSRILLAYRLGLIDRDVESYLQTLRKLRNDAAHSAHDIDLSKAPHVDRVIHMQQIASKCHLWDKFSSSKLNAKTEPKLSLFQSLALAVFNFECALLESSPLVISSQCTFNLLHIAPETDHSLNASNLNNQATK